MNKNDPDSRTQPIPLTGDSHPVENDRLLETETTQVMPVLQQPIERAVVQLRAEELVPTKEWVETGAVLVRKGLEVYPQTIPVEVLHEEVSIEHVPVNRVLAEGEMAAPWQDGEVLVIPVVHEEIVVVKRRVVREELRVSKVRVASVQQIKDSVRRETLTLDTEGKVRVLPGQNNPNPAGA